MTKIEWAEAVWNPILGCAKVSAGCEHCYAIREAHRLAGNPNPKIAGAYAGLTRRSGGKTNWTGKRRFLPERLEQPLRRRKPTRYFVNSMSDLFHEDVEDDWLDPIFAVMALCPQHRFLVLTKRPERAREYLTEMQSFGRDWPERWGPIERPRVGILNAVRKLHARADSAAWTKPVTVAWPLPNVWLGVSAENQETADQRVPALLATPAAVRWVSAEPLLGPIRLGQACTVENPQHIDRTIDWIVAGGESGPNARPMHPDWARSIRDQCQAAGTPFFHKQNGAWSVVYDRDQDDPDWRRCDVIARQTPKGRWLNLAGGHGFHGDRVVRIDRVGRKAAGRLLDGREWNEMP